MAKSGESAASRRAPTWLAAVVVVFVAIAPRGLYLVQIQDIGFFRIAVSDGAVYQQRADEIRRGDWLGPADFVHAPLYAYYLAAMRAVGGEGPWPGRIGQAVLGSAACGLMVFAGRRFFELRVGVLAGLILAFYPPAIFFDGLVQKTSLVVFLTCLILALAPTDDRSGGRRAFLLGALLGLLVLTQQSALVFAPLVILWVAVRAARAAPSTEKIVAPRGRPSRLRRTPRPTLQRGIGIACACLAGLVLALAPWVVRNLQVTGEFVLTTPNLGQNFAMGNHPEGTGTYVPLRRGRSSGVTEQAEWVKAAEAAAGRRLTARQVSDYYLAGAIEAIRAEPVRWLHLLLRKCRMTFESYEWPDTEDYYLYQQHSSLLQGLDRALHFGVLGPFAVAGIALSVGRRRGLWFLATWIVVGAAAVIVFVVFARYRTPLLPPLALFAAASIPYFIESVRQRAFARIAVTFVLGVGAAAIMNHPVQALRVPTATSYVNHVVALADQRRFGEALAELDRALAVAPQNADALWIRASTLFDQRRFEEALKAYGAAVEADGSFCIAMRGLGDCLLQLGRPADAEQQFRRTLTCDPGDMLAENGLAAVLAQQGKLVESAEILEGLLLRHPELPEAHLNLGTIRVALGRLDDAAASYRAALHLRPDYADAWRNLGAIHASRGTFYESIESYRKLLELRPDDIDAQCSLVRVLWLAGNRDEARSLLRRYLRESPQEKSLLALQAALQPEP